MSLSQFTEKKDTPKQMIQINVLDCLQKNQYRTLKYLIDNNAIFYDSVIGSETLLGYALKNTSVEERICDLFLAQKKKVEENITQIKTILFNIINNPTQIDEKKLTLYIKCRTFNEALKELVLSSKDALFSMQQENSLLRKILPTLDYKQAFITLTRCEAAFQKNELFNFDEKFITKAKTDPEFLNQLMLLLSTEKNGQTLSQKLVNYATVYSPESPLSVLFRDKPKFVSQCIEQAKRLSDETLELVHTLPKRSHELLVYHRTIIVAAYSTISPIFLNKCLSILNKHPTEQIHIEAWEAIADDDDTRLTEVTQHPDFNLFHKNPTLKGNMLHNAAELGHVSCLKVILNFIANRKLNNVHFASRDFTFKLLTSPDPAKSLAILSEAKHLTIADCQKIVFETLTDFNNSQKDELVITSLKHATIGVYHCTFAIKFPMMKYVVVQPGTPIYQYLAEQNPDLKAMIDKDNHIIQKITEDKLDSNDIDFDDLKIKTPQGKLLIEIAAECKSVKAIEILTQKKIQQGFAHQLMELKNGVDLYQLVMCGELELEKNRGLLDFLASDHAIAKKARLTLICWMSENINCYLYRRTVKQDFDKMTKLFSFIFKNDNKTSTDADGAVFNVNSKPSSWLEALLHGLNNAKEVIEIELKECQNAADIFTNLVLNKLPERELKGYSMNVELLTIIKNKIVNTENLNLKLKYYDLLFHTEYEDPTHQLYKIFHGFKILNLKHPKDYINILDDLKKDWEQTKTFAKGLEKLIQQKSKRTSSMDEHNIIPLTTLTGKTDNFHHFFKTIKETKEADDTLATRQQPQPTSVLKQRSTSQEPKDKDELDTLIATAKI